MALEYPARHCDIDHLIADDQASSRAAAVLEEAEQAQQEAARHVRPAAGTAA